MLVATVPASADDRARPGTSVSASVAAKTVTLHLRPQATVGGSDVLIGDIAILEGGDAKTRNRIDKLDIADPPRAGQSLHIPRAQVVYRLQLAGIEESLCQVRGARSVSVSTQMFDVPEKDVVEAARHALLEKLGPNQDDFDVHLSQPLRGPIRLSGSRDSLQLAARVRTARSLIGRVQVSVTILSSGKQQLELPVNFDVQLFQSVAVAKQRIERGQPLTKESVYFERRPADGAADPLIESTSLAGAKAKRTILPTQVISAADVEFGAEDNPVLVKQRDVVKMLVRAGGLRIAASGEALQDGRAGQMIRVRNVDSQNIVLGRVVDRSVVEIRF